MFNDNLPLILLAWMVVVGLMIVARNRRNISGVGLVLAYVLNLWMIHWAGSAIYLLPWYNGAFPANTVSGTEQSLYAVAAFAFGSLFIAPFVVNSGILPRASGIHEPDQRLPRAYLLVGGFFYILLTTSLGKLPTLNAIIAAGQELTVVGLGLCWWQAWRCGNRKQMIFWIVMAFLPPLLTIVTRGFIGYGAVATLSILIFVSNFAKSRVKVILAGTVLTYLALSVFVTYMRDRVEIRETVWGEQTLSNRLDRLALSADSFEWFDPFNPKHLARIDDRLNQSYLVGAAVEHLTETGDFARGETLWDAAAALVPRALWPDKPITAGSGNLVSRFTGFHYESHTSVGIGSVMEFYVNFGTMGVVIGFLILGIVVTAFDILATERLANSDLHGFVLYFLPGLALLQVGGQLVEVTASAAGAIVVALLVNKFLARFQSKQTPLDVASQDDLALPQPL